MGIADGVDEVHKATVARNVLKGYRPHEGYWPTEYFPAKREAAWEKFEPRFEADPELRDPRRGLQEVLRQPAVTSRYRRSSAGLGRVLEDEDANLAAGDARGGTGGSRDTPSTRRSRRRVPRCSSVAGRAIASTSAFRYDRWADGSASRLNAHPGVVFLPKLVPTSARFSPVGTAMSESFVGVRSCARSS